MKKTKQQAAVAVPRERLRLDPAWRFNLSDVLPPGAKSHGEAYMNAKSGYAGGAAAPDFDDHDWRRVDLPHDWVVGGCFDPAYSVSHGYLAGGVGWYRKTFFLPAADEGRCLWLEFDGVFRNSTVWLNGHRLGTEVSGYHGFRFAISDFAEYGGENVLAVRVDASEFEGWWYEGAGIYRHVWLTKAAPVHVAPAGVWVRGMPRADGAARAYDLAITTTVVNTGEAAVRATVVSRVVAPDGKTVAEGRRPVHLGPGETVEVEETGELEQVREWSVNDPALYRLDTELRVGERVLDAVSTPFGLRTIRFDPDHGFFLNGQPVKLKGVCNHQDHAGVGVALPDRLFAFRVEKLKAMGCNAWRCAHNPPAPELLDACDRLGMLVMDETRLMSSTDDELRHLEFMIRRDRNHPCVILWSMGNEEPLQGTVVGRRMVRRMMQVTRTLDPTRPITLAMNGAWDGPVAPELDVMGCNYFIDSYDGYHRAHPLQAMVGSETASTVSTRGVYVKNDAKGHLTAYDIHRPGWGAQAEAAWRAVADRAYMSGTFVWTGFDYRGEPTPYQWPCISSHFGILDTCGFPKDNYYYYRAWWRDEPVLHLLPHWNWPDRVGETIAVWAHGNCPEVELFLNGQSLGRQKMPRNGHLEWQVPYAPGVLSAKGYSGRRVVATAEVRTTGPATGLRLEPDRVGLAADGEDVAVVTALVTDGAGLVVPTADAEVSFSVSGPARLIGVGNGDPSSHEPDQASRRRAFAGCCMVLVQTLPESGNIVVEARADGLLTARTVLRAAPTAPRPFVGTVERGSSVCQWRISPVSQGEPDPGLAPPDSDQNSWVTIRVGAAAAPVTGYVLARAQTKAPRLDAARESLCLDFGGLPGSARVYINGVLAGVGDAPGVPFRVPAKVAAGEALTIAVVMRLANAPPTIPGVVGFVRVPTGK